VIAFWAFYHVCAAVSLIAHKACFAGGEPKFAIAHNALSDDFFRLSGNAWFDDFHCCVG
jgi:hypothetical protein